jgi:hypothetical protein
MPGLKTVQGGFAHVDSKAQISPVVAFQFNPEWLERTIVPADSGSQHKEAMRFVLELDATDALERGDPTASALGIYPALAALESLAQPTAEANGLGPNPAAGGLGGGMSFTVFIWGSRRVIPVRFTGLMIRETLFDERLNPLRATVEVSLEMLDDAELAANPTARRFMDSYRKQKEWLAGQPGGSGPTEEMLAALKNNPSG